MELQLSQLHGPDQSLDGYRVLEILQIKGQLCSVTTEH